MIQFRNGTRSFSSSMVDRYRALKRDKFPIAKQKQHLRIQNTNMYYLDYQEKDENKKSDGYNFSSYEYPTPQNSKALLIYLPEHGETAMNMGYFFKRLATIGVRVYSFDRKGFGMSQGRKGSLDKNLFLNQWNYIDQVGFLKGFPKNIPKFIIGQGYGALLGARLLEQRNDYFNGAVLINPLLSFMQQPGSFQQAIMKAKIFVNPDEIVPSVGVGNEEVKKLIQYIEKSDDLSYFKWTLSNYLATLEIQQETISKIADIKTPTLMLLSEQDSVSDFKAAKTAFQGIGSTDKKAVTFKDKDHYMIWLDQEYQLLETETFNWIKDRIK